MSTTRYTKKTKKVKRTKKQRKVVPNNRQLSTRIRKLEHQTELKYVDAFSTALYTASGSLFPIGPIAQGDDFNQRIGESVTVKFMNLKIRVQKAANIVPLIMRFCLFWDMHADGQANPPVLTSVDLNGFLDDTTISNPTLSPFNHRQSKRYRVLKDKVYIVNPESSTTDKAFNIYKNFNLGGAIIKYLDSGGTQTSIANRCLWMYFRLSASSALTANNVHSTRLWYTDS